MFTKEAKETQEYFPKIKRALRQHSRQGHSGGTHAQMHSRGLDYCIRIAVLANLEQIWCCVEAKEETTGLPKHIQMHLPNLLKCI